MVQILVIDDEEPIRKLLARIIAVSYTHLTLPTIA